MHEITSPTKDVIGDWLKAQHIDSFVCENCHGLHLPHMQALPGVLDSKIDIEDGMLLFSATVEIRPSCLLELLSHLAQLNSDYPTLKIFVDAREDALPILIFSHALLTDAGILQEQFIAFINHCSHEIEQALDYCRHNGWVFFPEQETQREPDTVLH